jgi:uncharacterized protein DUF4258
VIRFTKHAEEALALRRIEREWVISAVDAPDSTEPDPRRPGVIRSYKAIAAAANRALRVAHRPDGSDIVVITVHFDRGARQ